jgi:ParB-like chromosome segregation protein Spo0J
MRGRGDRFVRPGRELSCRNRLQGDAVGNYQRRALKPNQIFPFHITLLLSWVSGGRRNRELRIATEFTHEEIAQMIESSRETVTRLLRRASFSVELRASSSS